MLTVKNQKKKNFHGTLKNEFFKIIKLDDNKSNFQYSLIGYQSND